MSGEYGAGEEREKKKAWLKKNNSSGNVFYGRESHDAKRINFISQ